MKHKAILKHSFLILGLFVLLMFGCKKKERSPNKASGTLTDINGNIYHTVTIGTQVWTVENLKTTKFRNGDSVPNVTGVSQWSFSTTNGWCYYDNNKDNASIYGRLYNWFAITDSRNIAPSGWHVPTDTDWQKLIDYIGGKETAGGKLKETDTIHWESPNRNATNAYGFTALPGGGRTDYGNFNAIRTAGGWWSSTAYDSTGAWQWSIYNSGGYGTRYPVAKCAGLSVRLVMD